ncbi:MAG: PEPxxWA-CTERM sorting domain-containing protein [Gemmatimonadaceae bacterium]
MNRVRVLSLMSSLLLVAAPLSAQIIVVNGTGTPYTAPGTGTNNPTCAGQFDKWCAYDVRDNASVGQTTANPRSGNGSLAFSSPVGDGTGKAKADFDYLFSPANQFKIKDIQSMSYDWFRNTSSTNNAVQVPALRLIVEGPSAAYVDQLVFEPTYQPGGTTPAGSWQTSLISTGSYFWWNKDCQNRFGPGPDYAVSLATWGVGHSTTSGPGCTSAIADNAKVLGFSVGVGSGWNGQFDGAVDNISFRLKNQEIATTYNFEVASTVPEPSTYALMIAGLAAVGFAARRRRNNA